MRLQNYKFCENPGAENEWRLESVEFHEVNLVVGKNSAGKSRTLNTLVLLARFLSNRQKPAMKGADWDCEFAEGGHIYQYHLELRDGLVSSERFSKDGDSLLDRGTDGSGEIFSTRESRMVEFQTPTTDLAATSRRDASQHQFFDLLHNWGLSLFSYTFGTAMGKHSLALTVNGTIELDLYNQELVIAIFMRGQKDFGTRYIAAIQADMAMMGYPLESVTTAYPGNVTMGPAGLLGLSVKEISLGCLTEQLDISSGMFRTLSVIIQFNYAVMSSRAGCVVVDDIGEGLDFERSCELIDLLTAKAKASGVQLILSTNDRFVMNRIPLRFWTVLKRTGHVVSVFNYGNSKEYFDHFKFTGLNNFDFFAMDFVSENLAVLGEEESIDEEAGSVR